METDNPAHGVSHDKHLAHTLWHTQIRNIYEKLLVPTCVVAMAEVKEKVLLPSTQFVLKLCIPSFTLPSFKNALLDYTVLLLPSFDLHRTQFWKLGKKVLYLVFTQF